MTEKYLVTGGAGFIGSHMVERLLAQKKHVRVLDNFSTGKRENLAPFIHDIELHEGDIVSAEDSARAMEGVSHVVHLAAQASVVRSVEAPMETHTINVTGTLELLEAARNKKVKAFVLASTCAVYGQNSNLPIKEDTTPVCLSPYAASKLAAEEYVRLYRTLFAVPAVVFRLFNVFGPRQDPSSPYSGVISAFADKLSKKECGTIYGDGKQTRDFVFVKDVVRFFDMAVQRPEKFDASAYNVASGKQISILELYQCLAALAGSSSEPRMAPARTGEVRHSQGSVDRLRSAVGEKEIDLCISFKDGLAETFRAY
ncbi:MAG: NAD-dependent epimerase/dehydratase family protein [Bdellovibrionaceae bacterium]|nr:NAD-dependent epimerase/dehydratase family protein [Bdellovibrionales bacterium]MCB9255112.1 NAD-dependent epimerase/dehydratase family protein [Pseudobdellovibrionaceae bacterium]